VPARDEARTIAGVVQPLVELREHGVVDQVVVVDASTDGTGEIAARLGAEVFEQGALMPEFGPVLGKGDAMWRALSVLRGDVVCFLDADTESFSPHFATGLLGPLVCEPDVSFVKAFYRRAPSAGAGARADAGGRVNVLMARPALALLYPQLAGIHQPLAGEVAARRELLLSLPFATGYGVEIAMLIDAYRAAALEGLAQVDLDVRQNRHQPLSALAPMADAVLRAVAVRVEREERLAGVVLDAPVERPPLATLAAS